MRSMFLCEILLARTNSCLKRFEGVRLPHCALADHLDCNGAVQLLVVRFIYATHAALAQESFDAVARAEITSRSNDGRVHHLHGSGIVEGIGELHREHVSAKSVFAVLQFGQMIMPLRVARVLRTELNYPACELCLQPGKPRSA